MPLDSVRTARVLVREEFGPSEDRTEIISELEMLNSDAENTTGLLMVSNTPPEDGQLAPRRRSRLTRQTLPFECSTADELETVLAN